MSGIEKERKFLVKDDGWRVPGVKSEFISQSYFPDSVTSGQKIHLNLSEDGGGLLSFRFPAYMPIPIRPEILQKLGNEGIASFRDEKGDIVIGDRVEMRVRQKGRKYFLTAKAETSRKDERYELEIPISIRQARMLLQHTAGTVEKCRYTVPFEGRNWEVDVYEGGNKGLVVAEIELKNGDTLEQLPPWLSAENEVTGNKSYSNRALAHNRHGKAR